MQHTATVATPEWAPSVPLILDSSVKLGFIAIIASVFVAQFRLKSLLNYGKTLKFGRSPILADVVYISKSRFTDFYYLCASLSVANFVVYLYCSERLPFCRGISINHYDARTSIIINCLIFIHSLRRVFECHYVSRFNPAAKIHVSHYIVAIFFYTAINIINLPNFASTAEKPFSIASRMTCQVLTAILVALNLISQILQNRHHEILSTTKKYNHPTELHFKYVSNPHYLYEVLIYLTCFLIVLVNYGHVDYNWLLVVLWVIINLGASGYNSHKYYISESEKCSKNDSKHLNKSFVARYVMIPFVF